MNETIPTPPGPATTTRPVPEPLPATGPAVREHADGLSIEVGGEEEVDKRLAQIEMAGEEAAAGFAPAPHQPLAPEVRYLHVSRTIHQLVTDRNRSVGIFLFVTSVLFGAATALLNVPERVETIVSLAAIQYWCLPLTFGTLAIVGAFMSLILVRTRIGLVYEVAKMNALLGLPSDRVKRVNPLSIFFLMHLLVITLGAESAGLAVAMLASAGGGATVRAYFWAIVVGVALAYIVIFLTIYYVTVLHATSDRRLQDARA